MLKEFLKTKWIDKEIKSTIDKIKDDYNNDNNFEYKYVICRVIDVIGIQNLDCKNYNEEIILKIREYKNGYYDYYGKYILEDETEELYIVNYFKELNKDEEIRYIKLRDKYECETGKKLINFPILYSMYKVTDNGVYIENIKNSFTEFDLNNVISENCIPYKYNVGGNYSFKYLIMSMIEFK